MSNVQPSDWALGIGHWAFSILGRPECFAAQTETSGRTFSVTCGIVAFLLIAAHSTPAAPPALEHLHPAAAQTGTTNLVQAIGKVDAWPVNVWTDDPRLHFQATTNKGEFTVAVEAEAAIGPHLVRLFNDDGASRPRCFVVGSEVQTRELEPNDEWSTPQGVEKLPTTINGRLEKSGDVDSFAVSLNAGQTLVAAVEAYVLESPLDAVLRVLDSRGVQRAWNHDSSTLDPFLAFTAPRAGRYIVQVLGFPYPGTSEIRFYGNEKAVYRLHLHSGPYLRHTVPLGVSRAERTPLRLVAWNLPADAASATEWSPDRATGTTSVATLEVRSMENTLRLPIGDGREFVEREPNDGSSEANEFEVPGAVTGCLQRRDDTDRFVFFARKGESLRLAIQSVSLGFPVDVALRIENTNGASVAQSEGANGRDPEISFTPGGTGQFQAVVGSLVHRGGSNDWYRLSVTRSGPEFKASMSDQSFVFKAGKTNEMKATVTRVAGYKNRLTARVTGLPPGVTVAPVDVAEKGGDVTMQAVVATNAPAFHGVIQVVVSGDETNATSRAAIFSFVSTSENNGVPGGYRELLAPSTDQLWLTVQPAK